MREEVGTKACIVGKIVKSRVKWAGHMVRMKYDFINYRKEPRRISKKVPENEEDHS